MQPPPGDGPYPAGPVPCPGVRPHRRPDHRYRTGHDGGRCPHCRTGARRRRDNRKWATEARASAISSASGTRASGPRRGPIDTGVTKDYDATQGDGQVHVTVRDAKGEVIDSYTYPRSRNVKRDPRQEDRGRPQEPGRPAGRKRVWTSSSGNALKEKRRLASELGMSTQAELEARLKRCRGVVDDAPAGTGALPAAVVPSRRSNRPPSALGTSSATEASKRRRVGESRHQSPGWPPAGRRTRR